MPLVWFKKRGVRVLILASGGTAGHVFPAESLGRELRERGYRVLFITDARGSRFLRAFRDAFRVIRAATPSVSRPFEFLKACGLLLVGFIQSFFVLIRERPVAVVGFGGYPSFPVLLAAFILRIPIFLQEQNAVLGRVNRLFIRFSRRLFAPEKKIKHLPDRYARKVVLSDVSLRQGFRVGATPFFPPDRCGQFNLLVFGGSQGSKLLTRVTSQALVNLPQSDRKRLVVVQQCHRDDIDALNMIYRSSSVSCTLSSFFEDMPVRMISSHLIISRAGAMSVREIRAVERPALFVPLACALDQDQLANALSLTQAGAAFLCLEKNFSPEYLTRFLSEVLSSSDRLERTVAALRGLNFKSAKRPHRGPSIADTIDAELSRS